MSGFHFMWDAIQAGQIQTLEERIEELEKRTEILKEWVDYLNTELEKAKNDSLHRERTRDQ